MSSIYNRHFRINGFRYRFERFYDPMSRKHALVMIQTAPSGDVTRIILFPEAIPVIRSYLDLGMREIREEQNKRSSFS